jgi:hypothetical protein
VEQSDRGRAKKNQGGSHYHEQKMLHHVGGEQLLVQFGKRRPNSQP